MARTDDLTPGDWFEGEGGYVFSRECPEPCRARGGCHPDYCGHLVAESIGRADRKAIAAVPRLLRTLHTFAADFGDAIASEVEGGSEVVLHARALLAEVLGKAPPPEVDTNVFRWLWARFRASLEAEHDLNHELRQKAIEVKFLRNALSDVLAIRAGRDEFAPEERQRRIALAETTLRESNRIHADEDARRTPC